MRISFVIYAILGYGHPPPPQEPNFGARQGLGVYLDYIAILFHILCTQHVSDINISIVRSLRLCCWITTSVVLFWFVVCWRFGAAEACNTDTTQTQPYQISNTQRSLQHWHYSNPAVPNLQHTTNLQHWHYSNPAVPNLQHTTNLQHWHHSKPAVTNLQHTTNREQNDDVVIQQHSRKLLMMDILMSETCWVHKKWNKIASDITLIFYSSTITMKHGPINIIQ